MPSRTPGGTDLRTRLLGAAIELVRERGFTATSVDDICRSAGATKGAFFHHFRSKEELGVEAARHWGASAIPVLTEAPWRREADPVDRVLGYIDHRTAMIEGEAAAFTCFAGTLASEAHGTPALRVAAGAAIAVGAAVIENDLAVALARRPIPGVTAEGLALHVQAVLQGAFVVAKAAGDAEVARASLGHLRRYVMLLFGREPLEAGDEP